MEVIIGCVNLTKNHLYALKRFQILNLRFLLVQITSHGIWSLELVLMHPNDGIKNKEENACRL